MAQLEEHFPYKEGVPGSSPGVPTQEGEMTKSEIGSTEVSGMAYIGMIVGIMPIENADRIEAVVVDCIDGGEWGGIVQKGEYRIGDRCEVYLQDAIVPDTERFAFMEKRRYRVRMIRLRGAPSEVLIMPMQPELYGELDVGTDVTNHLEVQKYTKGLPQSIAGRGGVSFPSFIPKTDEQNFQKVRSLVDAVQKDWFYITEKCDGTSCTFYNDGEGHFGVCSRRIEYKHREGLYWQLSEKYGIEAILAENPGIAIQAEGVGPGIQKNPMGLDEVEMRVFDIYDIKGHHYWDGAEVYEFCQEYNLPMVRVLKTLEGANFTADDWRELAEGTYENGNQREGIVVRPVIENYVGNQRVSFKVINLNYGR